MDDQFLTAPMCVRPWVWLHQKTRYVLYMHGSSYLQAPSQFYQPVFEQLGWLGRRVSNPQQKNYSQLRSLGVHVKKLKLRHLIYDFYNFLPYGSRERWNQSLEQSPSTVAHRLYIWYDSVYLTCSKKLMGSQLSLPHGTNKKLKCKTKNKMMNMIGPVQSRYREAVQ